MVNSAEFRRHPTSPSGTEPRTRFISPGIPSVRRRKTFSREQNVLSHLKKSHFGLGRGVHLTGQFEIEMVSATPFSVADRLPSS
jgi:hypothetical protein